MFEDIIETDISGSCSICGKSTKFYDKINEVFICSSRCSTSYQEIEEMRIQKLFRFDDQLDRT